MFMMLRAAPFDFAQGRLRSRALSNHTHETSSKPLAQDLSQLAAGDQFGDFAKVVREDSVLHNRRRHSSNRGVRSLAALAGLHRSAKVQRLGDRQGFNG